MTTNPIKGPDMVAEGALQPTIKDVAYLYNLTKELIAAFKEQLTITQQLAKTNMFGDSKGVQNVAKNYRDASLAAAELKKAQEQIAALEKQVADLIKRRTEETGRLKKSWDELSEAERKELVNAEKAKQVRADTIKAAKEQANAEKNINSVYEQRSKNLNKMRKEYRDLAAANMAATKEAKALLKTIQEEDKALKEIDASMGIHTRNVGNYKSATAGLQMSVNQITRELPAFANTLQTGFMAISNNIPTVVDEIGRLKLANKELAEQGKPTQSVFKGLVSAIFSWQTALSVGIMLLTVYGEKIVKALAGTDAFTKAHERNMAALKKENAELERNNEYLTKIAAYRAKLNAMRLGDPGSQDWEGLENINAEIERAGQMVKNLEAIEKELTDFRDRQDEDSEERAKANEKLAEAIDKAERARMEESYKLWEKDLFFEENKKKLLEEELNTLFYNARKKKILDDEAIRTAELREKSEKTILSRKLKGIDDEIAANNAAIEKLKANASDLEQIRSYELKNEELRSAKRILLIEDVIKAEKRAYDLFLKMEQARIEGMKEGEEREIAAVNNTYNTQKIALEKEFKDTKDFDKLITQLEANRVKEIEAIQYRYWKQRIEDEKENRASVNDAIKEGISQEEQIGYAKAEREIEDEKKRRMAIIEIRRAAITQQLELIDNLTKLEREKLKTEYEKLGRELLDLSKKQNKALAKQAQSFFDELNKYEADRASRHVKELDKQIAASEKRQDQLRQIAQQGNLDAKSSLAEEEKNEAKLERQKQQVERLRRQQELYFAALKTYTAKVEAGDKNALGNTLKDMTVLSAAIRSLPGFYEGAERVSDALGQPDMPGKDGYAIRVDGRERIFTGDQNDMIDPNLSNDEAARVLSMYSNGLLSMAAFDGIPRGLTSTSYTFHTDRILNGLEDVKKAIQNIPVPYTDYNTILDAVTTEIRSGNARTRTHFLRPKP